MFLWEECVQVMCGAIRSMSPSRVYPALLYGAPIQVHSLLVTPYRHVASPSYCAAPYRHVASPCCESMLLRWSISPCCCAGPFRHDANPGCCAAPYRHVASPSSCAAPFRQVASPRWVGIRRTPLQRCMFRGQFVTHSFVFGESLVARDSVSIS